MSRILAVIVVVKQQSLMNEAICPQTRITLLLQTLNTPPPVEAHPSPNPLDFL